MIYDLIVIGGGPAGYLAAERASHEGLTTLLIEKKFIGGVCLNEGCIPSKALLYSAKLLDGAKHGEKYGVVCGDIRLDHGTVIARKNKVVNTLVSGIKGALKRNKVTIIDGIAAFGEKSADDYVVSANGTDYKATRVLIATGSAPIMPPIPGLKEGFEQGLVLTNREILDLPSIPQSLVIVGGGVIGLEMASYFNSVGSKVTIIEMLDHIAGSTDREISDILMKNYQKKGVEFRLSSKVVELTKDAVVYESDGKTFSVPAAKILMSIGRRPVTEGLGLEKIGVELVRGAVKTDERGRTNIPNIYAAGDVNGVSMLAHTAYREAEVCVNNMVGKKDLMRYCAIPSIIYTNPEVGCVGETEESAKQKGLDFEVAKISMLFSGRYVAENEGGDGICKILVDRKYRRLLGVHMIGNHSSEIIFSAGIMVETEMVVDDIKQLVFPHPSVGEVIREGIFSIHDAKGI